jgi:ribose transport system substrate-binding protein
MTGALAALVFTLLLVACGSDSGSTDGTQSTATEGGSTTESAKGSTVTYVTGFKGLDYYESIVCAARPVADEHGFDFSSQDPEKYDPAVQVPIVDAVIQRTPDVLMLSPTSPVALAAPVKRAQSGGSKVILVGTSLKEQIADGFVGSDNEEAGRLAAEAMIEKLGDKKGKIAILSVAPGSNPDSEARAVGFEKEIAKVPGLEYLGREIVQFDSADAAQKMNALVSGNDDLVGVFATFGIASKGAASVLRTRDMSDAIVLIGGDDDDALEKLVRDGLLDGIAFDNTPEMGRQALSMANSALTNQPYEKEVRVPAGFADAETLDDPENKESRATQACG